MRNPLRSPMRTLRFHEYGKPLDVLGLEQTEPPHPAPGQIRIAVHACGLTPADWALCGGLFAGDLPRGIGLEAAGMVERVTTLAGGPVDVVLDAGPVSNALPDLIRTVPAPHHVLTLSDFAAAQHLGVRYQFDEGGKQRNDVLDQFAQLAAEGRF